MVAGLKDIPFVFELGDLWPNSISAVGAMKKGLLLSCLEKFEMFLYRRSVAIAALTNAFKRNLVERGVSDTKIHVVVNGVDLSRYGPKKRNKNLAAEWNLTGKFVVGYIGTHGMAHGLVNVLDTADLMKDDPNITFLFVGAGAERESLVKESKQRGQTNIFFAPHQPKEQMPDVWSLCDVALVHLRDSPAFADVIPSKIFEAMAMGLPLLLVSPKGEASDLIKSYDAGLWCPAGDPGLFSCAVSSLSVDKLKYDRMAKASLDAAVKHSRENQARKMLEVFQWSLDR